MSQNEESSDEAFYDAVEETERISKMDLQTSIEETVAALDLFLNNRFSEALGKMKPWAGSSMYHSLGYGTILYMQAIMTFEMEDIDTAIRALKQSGHLCQKYRKKSTVGHSIKKIMIKPNYDLYTEEQVHAELCYAECLLLRALLTFIQDENLVNFIKGGMKIRSCYQSYKDCFNILKMRSWENSDLKIHFESGVKMGVGAFNLLISQLPSRVLKLLEFLGFSGNRFVGLRELDEGFSLTKSLRGPLCSTVLLAYHTVICFILGAGDGDVAYAEKISLQMLDVYPKGAIFIYFYGRVHVIKGEIDEAISRFEEGVTAQLEWVQYHHMCYWELMWCHCYNLDWRKAADFAELLLQGSRWSKATYTYQKAVFLCMLTDTSSNQEEIVNLFRKVPSLKQRIAGKSLPIEKFAVKKSQRYFNQENMLILPAVELVYVWNGFTILGKNKDLITSILSIIQEAENLVNKSNGQYRTDNLCLVKLLKGMCLRYLDSPLQAEECFTEVYRNEKNIIEDHYLVPYSLMELGLLSLNQGDLITSQALLEKSKNDYKGFSLESRLHFRVHSSLNLIKSMQQQFLTLPDNYNPLPSPSPSPVPSPIPSPSTCE